MYVRINCEPSMSDYSTVVITLDRYTARSLESRLLWTASQHWAIRVITRFQTSLCISSTEYRLPGTFHSFIHQWLYSPLLRPGHFFSFVIFFTRNVGLLGRVISPSPGRYLHTGQHKHRINAHTNIHALSGIRTHVPNFRASEDSSYFRPRGHYDRLTKNLRNLISIDLRKICLMREKCMSTSFIRSLTPSRHKGNIKW
jgi:hypothetical protein